MRNDKWFSLDMDTVVVRHDDPREGPAFSWIPLADGVTVKAGDWVVLRDGDGLAWLAVDGDGHRTKLLAVTGRVPAGTLVCGDHLAGAALDGAP